MIDFSEAFDRLLCVFFPARCILCGEVVAYDDMWCGKCECKSAAAIALPKGSALTAAIAPLEYCGNVRKATLRLKIRPDKRIASFFAQQIYSIMQQKWPSFFSEFDVIVPVPVSEKRLKFRKFNHAELIAVELSKLIGIPVLNDALLQRDDAAIQHKLTAKERAVNAQKAFGIQNAESIAGLRVLIVDDIYTTGATMNACSALIISAGAASVSAATATYTNSPRCN